jgi:adenine phosphoribosyltransferase
MSTDEKVYSIEVAGVHRDLPLMEVKPGLCIAVLNILGDTELVQAAAAGLAGKLATVDYMALVTAEAKSIPLICAMAIATDKPYVVLRKTHKPYMGDSMRAETLSITTGKPQTLYLDEKDRTLIAGKRIVLIDDVISTGSTLQAMRLLVSKAGAEVAAEAAILTEGERSQWEHIYALGHLPLFTG